MERRAVTISRTLAAGGEEIGRLVAQELDFRYIDDEIVIRAATAANVPRGAVAEVENLRPMIARILETMDTGKGDTTSSAEDTAALPLDSVPLLDNASRYVGLIEQVIRETAAEGQVVIVAHGASIPLADLDHVLRVLVTAPTGVRAERHMRAAGLDQRRAKKAVEDSDRERKEFLRRFYRLRGELPTHYDLVLNTDRLTIPQVAKLIVSAAEG